MKISRSKTPASREGRSFSVRWSRGTKTPGTEVDKGMRKMAAFVRVHPGQELGREGTVFSFTYGSA